MRERLSSVGRMREVVRELRGAVPKLRKLERLHMPTLGMGGRIPKGRGLLLLAVLALVAWWFWRRERQAKQPVPPLLKG